MYDFPALYRKLLIKTYRVNNPLLLEYLAEHQGRFCQIEHPDSEDFLELDYYYRNLSPELKPLTSCPTNYPQETPIVGLSTRSTLQNQLQCQIHLMDLHYDPPEESSSKPTEFLLGTVPPGYIITETTEIPGHPFQPSAPTHPHASPAVKSQAKVKVYIWLNGITMLFNLPETRTIAEVRQQVAAYYSLDLTQNPLDFYYIDDQSKSFYKYGSR